jgi:hypothetical protein
MPDPASLSPSPSAPARPPTSPPSVTPSQHSYRYQVREELWGNRKRFVVRDTATHTTIAIRTTRQIVDSDLMRLNWAARDRPDPESTVQPVPSDSPSELIPEGPSQRQCGRCRQLFASDPARNPAALQEWWLCEACHAKLMGTSRPPTGSGPSGAPRTPGLRPTTQLPAVRLLR